MATGDDVVIGTGSKPARIADVWPVRYDPRIAEVPVARGENRHRVLPIVNTVRELTRLGNWNGEPVSLPMPPAQAGLESAILVQLTLGGGSLAARKL